MTALRNLDALQRRYVDLLLAKVEASESPDPDLLDRIEGILALRAPAHRDSAPMAPERRRIAVEDVIDVVARHFHQRPADLVGDSRVEPLTTVRHLAMRLARELTGATYEQIGAVFNRNHATVIYACRQAAGMAVGDVMEAIEAEFTIEHDAAITPTPKERTHAEG